MVSLDVQLEKNQAERVLILKKIDEGNRKRKIECGCGDYHKVGDLSAIQTHWYESPSGCDGGDRWHEGELQFVCPETEVVNRLMFDDEHNDIPLEERELYRNNPASQFSRKYKELFREVEDVYNGGNSDIYGEMIHRKSAPARFNNYFVSEHRKEFGLMEKKR